MRKLEMKCLVFTIRQAALSVDSLRDEVGIGMQIRQDVWHPGTSEILYIKSGNR